MNMCEKLHDLFSKMKKYDCNSIDKIPFERGIYIFFDKNEKYKKFNRIVRVGTHGTSKDNDGLKERLDKHFNANKNNSIFRKNVGRGIIYKYNYGDEILRYWNCKSSKKWKLLPNYGILYGKRQEVEKKITSYISKLYFVVVPFNSKVDRDRFETALISSLCQCEKFESSSKWLGNYIPDKGKTKIKKNRIWCSDKADKKPLSDIEYSKLYNICKEYFICKKS